MYSAEKNISDSSISPHDHSFDLYLFHPACLWYAGFFLPKNRYNSSVNIVTALETLTLEGIEGDHDQVIETVLSKLFVRGEEVHKAYKHRSADFADLAHRDIRREYIAEDFYWNNVMAPEIYLELRHVKREGDHFVHVDTKEAEDWYIVMKKIDSTRDLLRTLERGVPLREDLADYARILTKRLEELTDAKGEELAIHFEKGQAHLASEILGVCDWAYTATPFLSTSEVDRAKALMKQALETVPYFSDPIDLSIVIDTNPENIIFLSEGVSFIDVMPPKDTWRVHDRYFPLCRTSADISALQHADHADILHEQYAKDAVLPPEIVRVVYELAAALIQVPYRNMLGKDTLATAYADFVRMRMDDLKMLLNTNTD